MKKIRVLFICVHNSARSQMAEALLNHLAGDRFQAESAGLEPGTLNPLAVAAMADLGIDISSKQTRDVFELYKQSERYDYVVTVCDQASGERCPLFPGITRRMHWGLDDPASFTGSHAERLKQTIRVREQIRERIQTLIKEVETA
jgi:arsenate reductase